MRSSSELPIDEIQTFSQTRGVPSEFSICFNSGAVFGSMLMTLNVRVCACPCMFDWPARMNTFNGAASATVALVASKARDKITE